LSGSGNRHFDSHSACLFLNPKKSLEFLTLGEDNQQPPLPSPQN
jgi:hypothetical protein